MRNLLVVTAIMAGLGATAAQASTTTIIDAPNDFLPTFTGNGGVGRDALDITKLTVNFDDPLKATILVTATFAGDIADGNSGFYVLGIDTGTPKTSPGPFNDIGEGDIFFDDRVIIQKNGLASLVNAANQSSPLTATPIGNTLQVAIALASIPANIPADQFRFSLWSVSTEPGAPTGHNAIADFAPDHGGVTAGGVPEPASWALMITGFGLAGATMRARRRWRAAQAA